MCYYNSQANLSKRQKNNRIWFNTKLTKFIFVFKNKKLAKFLQVWMQPTPYTSYLRALLMGWHCTMIQWSVVAMLNNFAEPYFKLEVLTVQADYFCLREEEGQTIGRVEERRQTPKGLDCRVQAYRFLGYTTISQLMLKCVSCCCAAYHY